jgi:hypothetical protein
MPTARLWPAHNQILTRGRPLGYWPRSAAPLGTDETLHNTFVVQRKCCAGLHRRQGQHGPIRGLQAYRPGSRGRLRRSGPSRGGGSGPTALRAVDLVRHVAHEGCGGLVGRHRPLSGIVAARERQTALREHPAAATAAGVALRTTSGGRGRRPPLDRTPETNQSGALHGMPLAVLSALPQQKDGKA